jgi:hypothetical protein
LIYESKSFLINWSMIRHDRRHWKAPSSTDHYLRAISRVWLDRHWWEHGRQNETRRILVGSPILFFQMWHFGPGLRAKRRREVLYARIVEDLMCVCVQDHLIWHCERFRVEMRPRWMWVLGYPFVICVHWRSGVPWSVAWTSLEGLG